MAGSYQVLDSPYKPTGSRFRPRQQVLLGTFVLGVLAFFVFGLVTHSADPSKESLQRVAVSSVPSHGSQVVKSVERKAVPLDFYVMSRCPDAIFCETYMKDIVQQLEPIISPRLHYIADMLPDGRIKCMHGAEEDEDPGTIGQESSARLCADPLDIDYNQHIASCVKTDGHQLLLDSVRETREREVK
ncbi:hypothetical protein IWQ61_005018 [Dispira simplex]|nr:hypothetical protein IWQ61_005018 [Dispira simplex]